MIIVRFDKGKLIIITHDKTTGVINSIAIPKEDVNTLRAFLQPIEALGKER